MKIAMPISAERGLESPVHGHFGSAPGFLAVDAETLAAETLPNGDREHAPGACSPLRALAGARPDAVLVGGLGAGSLAGLRQLGIRVYRVPEGTPAAEAVRRFQAGQLPELTDVATCAGHAHGAGGCGHSG